MVQRKLTDPADATSDDIDKTLTDEMTALQSPDGLSEAEVGGIPSSVTRATHPFEGYPIGRKVKVGETLISTTFIVILNDPDAVFQDESGKRVTQETFKKDAKGNDIRAEDADGRLKKPKVASRKIITLKTYHNRITNVPNTGDAIDTVFDRVIKVGNRDEVCAIVPSHSARAQICLALNKAGRVEVDRRYKLADLNQIGRLRRVFDAVNYQQMKAERLAQKFDAEPESSTG